MTTAPMTAHTSRMPRGLASFLRLLERPEGAISFVMTLIVVVIAVAGSALAPQNPEATDLGAVLSPPSAAHWFGTDEAGRDLFSRVLAGAQYTMAAAVVVVLLSFVLGTAIGVIAGYVGGWVGNALARLTDLFLAFPALLIAIAVSAALGQGLPQTVVALAVVAWSSYARIAYVQTVSARNALFVDAARTMKTPAPRILTRHIFPTIASPLLIKGTMDLAFAAEWIAALGFIGLGATPPTPEWGAMIASSRNYALNAWWYVTFPSLALMFTIVGFVIFGGVLERQFAGRNQLGRRALRELRA